MALSKASRRINEHVGPAFVTVPPRKLNKRVTDVFSRLKCQIGRSCTGCGEEIPAGETVFAYQGTYWHEACAMPKAREKTEGWERKPDAYPKRPRTGPTYALDHEAIAYRYSDPLGVVEIVVDATARPGWNRDSLCFNCEHWNPKKGLLKFPSRPGADDPTTSCNGCLFSYLDEVCPAPQHRGYGSRRITELRVMQ